MDEKRPKSVQSKIRHWRLLSQRGIVSVEPKVSRPAFDEALVEPAEGDIRELALSGKLSRAAKRAIHSQRRQGLPITFARGGQIIRQSANGTTEVLGTVVSPAFVFPSHVRVIRK